MANSTPEGTTVAQIKTNGLYGEQINSVPVASNRATSPINSNRWYWSKVLVRRGHPLRQVLVSVSVTALQATLTHVLFNTLPTLLGAGGLIAFGAFIMVELTGVLIGVVSLHYDKQLMDWLGFNVALILAGVVIGLL